MVDRHKQSEQQFLEAFEQYSDGIFRFCYYRVFDAEKAKDLTQEAYCKAWKYLAEGNDVQNLRALVYKIAHNLIIDDSRKRKMVSLDKIMAEGFSPHLTPAQPTDDYFIGKEILKIVESLDKKYRDVIVMRYINDLSIKEIASILNETENNIYVRISRGFSKVKEIFLKNQIKITKLNGVELN